MKILRTVLDLLWLPNTASLKYFQHEAGRAVSVYVSGELAEGDKLVIKLQRKLHPGDVEDGKLASVVREEVVRRGGKRVTTLALQYESAEMLHAVLSAALKDARRRRSWFNIARVLFFLCTPPVKQK